MGLQVNKIIPNGKITLRHENQVVVKLIHELFLKKKVLLFGVPGAFTEQCSSIHFPSYIEREIDFYNYGFDLIACLSVNDTGVMNGWKKTYKENGILMLSDGDASYVTNIKLNLDEGIYAGMRSQRFAAILDNLMVERLFVDESGVKQTHADYVLSKIKGKLA